MLIETARLVEGARHARGIAVVVDVFRASSVVAWALARGAARVIPVAGVEQALALRQRLPGALLLGERFGRPLPGFDGGNSPAELLSMPLAGRTLVHTTHAGTQGFTGAVGAEAVLSGAFVNFGATLRWVRERRPQRVTLVAMGQHGETPCVEDEACVEHLRRCLADTAARPPSTGEIVAALREAPAAAKFFDPAADWAPERDFELCTGVDAVDVAAVLDRSDPALPAFVAAHGVARAS